MRRARPRCFRAVELLPPRIELLKGDPKFARDFHRRPVGCFSEVNSFTLAFLADFLNRVLHLSELQAQRLPEPFSFAGESLVLSCRLNCFLQE